jgi:hypothetical protein
MRPFPRSLHDRAISGELAAMSSAIEAPGGASAGEDSYRRAQRAARFDPQAIWSTRVPWPGGKAATTGGWASVASLVSLSFCWSGVLAALVSGVDTGAVTGADTAIAETLIENVLGCSGRP